MCWVVIGAGPDVIGDDGFDFATVILIAGLLTFPFIIKKLDIHLCYLCLTFSTVDAVFIHVNRHLATLVGDFDILS